MDKGYKAFRLFPTGSGCHSMTGEQNHLSSRGHAAAGSSPSARPPVGSSGGRPVDRTVTKKELVSRIADKTGQTKVVTKDVIQMFLDEIISELARGNRLEFREFGVFEIKERAARKAQNPRTLEKVDVPAKKIVKFKVGRMMKEKVGLS